MAELLNRVRSWIFGARDHDTRGRPAVGATARQIVIEHSAPGSADTPRGGQTAVDEKSRPKDEPGALVGPTPEAGGRAPLAEGAGPASVDPPPADREAARPHKVAPVPTRPEKGTAPWRYLEVTEDEPDRHEEFGVNYSQVPLGMEIVGARARGVMHKNNGTNCDDWFEFRVAEDWTLIAVADGAGSARFSRIGAKVACEVAVQYLDDCLRPHKIGPRAEWSSANLRYEETGGIWTFADPDLEVVHGALHGAMAAAFDAVERKALEIVDSPPHVAVMGRDLTSADLASTLLLAVHCLLESNGKILNLVMTCQIGDGMLSAVDEKGTLHLLADPDKGDFGGQTIFLTSRKRPERASLVYKTKTLLCPLRALMVMSDGVSDLYFPNETELLNLYAELVLHGVIAIPATDEQIARALEERGLSMATLEAATYHRRMEAVCREGRVAVDLPSAQAFAKALGFSSVKELVGHPLLLAAGAQKDDPGADSETRLRDRAERLRLWLDAYEVRGERDDRTLVVLSPEVA